MRVTCCVHQREDSYGTFASVALVTDNLEFSFRTFMLYSGDLQYSQIARISSSSFGTSTATLQSNLVPK